MLMGSWHHYIIKSDDPDEALEKISEVFNCSVEGRVLDDSRVLINQFGETVIPSDDRWNKCSEVIERFMEVQGSDTSDVCGGGLYGFENREVERIDDEHSDWLISGDRFKGESFLRSYFYDVHSFKMWAGRSEVNSDYEDRYRPEEHLELEHECPRCDCNNVRIESWDTECKRCGYQDKKPRFEPPFYSWIYEQEEDEWQPSYDSKFRNLIANLWIKFRNLKIYAINKLNSFKRVMNVRKNGLPVIITFENNNSGKFLLIHNRINKTRKGIGIKNGKIRLISRDWLYTGVYGQKFDDVMRDVEDMDTPSKEGKF